MLFEILVIGQLDQKVYFSNIFRLFTVPPTPEVDANFVTLYILWHF